MGLTVHSFQFTVGKWSMMKIREPMTDDRKKTRVGIGIQVMNSSLPERPKWFIRVG
jgi:hypothetical protein